MNNDKVQDTTFHKPFKLFTSYSRVNILNTYAELFKKIYEVLPSK